MDFKKSTKLDNIIISMIKEYGLIDHQLNQVNDFYNSGIYEIFDSQVPISIQLKPSQQDSSLYDKISCDVYFRNVIMETPSNIDVSTDTIEPMFPTETLAKRQTYSSNIRADIYFNFKGTKDDKVITNFEKTLENRSICTMPVLVGSSKCNTYGLSKDVLRFRNEDPENVGGYYIIKGQEYYINTTEASAPNITKIFRGNKSDNYLAKAEFTSRSGVGNQPSYRVTTMLGNNNIIYVLLYCGIFRDNIRIPLPILINALGVVQPFGEMIQKICYNQVSIENVCQTCWSSFEEMINYNKGSVKYAQEYIADLLPDSTKSLAPLNKDGSVYSNDQYVSWVAKELIRNFENCCFSVLNNDDYTGKLDYLYRMVYWTVAAGLSQTNDLIDNRDISTIKRFVSPAYTVHKVTKTVYRHNIVQNFRAELRNVMLTSKFVNIDPEKIFKNEQKDISSEFQKSITQAINAGGNITNKDGVIVAKSQMKIGMAQHKNRLCIISQARAIDGNSFGDNAVTTSSRNKEFRRNEPSLTGGICPIHSATESTNVGTKKQLAVSTRITIGEHDDEIIELLKETDGLEFDNPLFCNPIEQAVVYCNGLAIAKTKKGLDDFEIIRTFNRYKREGKIPRMTSITYNSARNEINFFTDEGRLVRPVLPIIRVNSEGKEVPGGTPGATETVNISEEDLDNCDFTKLLNEGKIVYLSVNEAPTYRVATCYEEWIESLDSPIDFFDFIEIPSGIFSLAVLTKPFLCHDQPPRSVYQSSQSRQTGGKNVENIHLRYDKEMVTQFYTGKASVCTMFRELGMEEHGENVWLAIMQTTSDNQEDSVILKKGSVDCGMFSMVKFDARRIPVDSKEILGIDEEMKVSSIRGVTGDPFSNIDPSTGIARRNTKIAEEPVVVVAKSIRTVETINGVLKHETKNKSYSTNNKYEVEYIDHTNKCEIDKVTHVQISTVKSRNPEVGDKFSTRAGQKGIVGRICETNEMPYTLDGDRPDVILNPSLMNTRRTIGMIYDGVCSMIASKLGIYIKGTTVPEPVFFSDMKDLDLWIEKELRPQYRNYPKKDAEKYIAATVASIKELRKQLEDNNWDTHTMISGVNGEIIKGEAVMVRIFYQRLLKVVKDAFYIASDSVNYDIHYRQPDAGAKHGGGLRQGEMETGAGMSHGGAYLLGEKTHLHSDGMIMQLCRCGRQSNWNYETKTAYCYHCREKTDPVEMQSAFSTQLLIDKLAGTGVGLALIPEKYQIYEVIQPTEGKLDN